MLNPLSAPLTSSVRSLVRLSRVARASAGLAASILLLAVSACGGEAGDPGAETIEPLPLEGEHYGRTYEEWTAWWYEWALSVPVSESPVYDETGKHCASGQDPDVWMLGGTFTGSTVTRNCTVPADQAVMLPVINSFSCQTLLQEIGYIMSDEEVIAMVDGTVDAVTEMHVTVDGVSMGDPMQFRTQTTEFTLTLPEEGNFYQAMGLDVSGELQGCFTAGYWMLFDPLPPGEHTITFGGAIDWGTEDTADDFFNDNTYHLTVE